MNIRTKELHRKEYSTTKQKRWKQMPFQSRPPKILVSQQKTTFKHNNEMNISSSLCVILPGTVLITESVFFVEFESAPNTEDSPFFFFQIITEKKRLANTKSHSTPLLLFFTGKNVKNELKAPYFPGWFMGALHVIFSCSYLSKCDGKSKKVFSSKWTHPERVACNAQFRERKFVRTFVSHFYA